MMEDRESNHMQLSCGKQNRTTTCGEENTNREEKMRSHDPRPPRKHNYVEP